MGIFDFLKPKTPEEKRDAYFNGLRRKTIVREKKSVMQSIIGDGMFNDFQSDEDPNGIGEFGLTKTNPIPVNGIDNVLAYVDKLRYKYTSKTDSSIVVYHPVSIIRTMETDESKIGSNKPDDLPAGATQASNILCGEFIVLIK